MSSNHPIGIFDSGIGGITVLRRIRETLPKENFIYIADTGHMPYGEKSHSYIQDRCLSLAAFLIRQGAKAIVVACNTATAAAIATLRERYTVPIIGIEPGVKPALAMTRSGVVGILATRETLKSDKFKRLVSRFGNGCRLEVQGCSGLMECVEQMDLDGKKTRALVAAFVQPLVAKGADTLVLGCTHYPFLLELIQEMAGSQVRVIDTGVAVAKEVCRRLGQADLLADGDKPNLQQFWTSGDPDKMQTLLNALWDVPAKACKLPDGV